tara:strand:- start:367 stop:534 length:168 start_codon:yes stop_codon:yes gene_type:complete
MSLVKLLLLRNFRKQELRLLANFSLRFAFPVGVLRQLSVELRRAKKVRSKLSGLV